ncbi:MAG: GNAT family N-acetyltransferase [Ruminococcus sp.]|nr:GNAT family N-acetyltransferase [Ruminococcus sp.]
MIIQEMKKEHTDEVFQMMKVFYSSPAVSTNGSDEIFMSDIQNCINDNPFLEGYVFAEQDKIMGYAMAAKSFSTEFGKPCVWIEDIYIKPDYRGKGIGSQFLDYIEQKYRDSILRLEVEEDNTAAVHVYNKSGFDVLPYMEMKK